MATPDIPIDRDLTEDEIEAKIANIRLQQLVLKDHFNTISPLLVDSTQSHWINISSLKEQDIRTLLLWIKEIVLALQEMELCDFIQIHTSDWKSLDSTHIWKPMNELRALVNMLENKIASPLMPIQDIEIRFLNIYKSLKEISEGTID